MFCFFELLLSSLVLLSVFVSVVPCLSSSLGYETVFFFFKQKTAYEVRISDWSSDVCSSDLEATAEVMGKLHGPARPEEVVDQIARGARAVAGGELAALLRVRDGVPSIVATDGTGQAELPALLDGVSAEVRSALAEKETQWVRRAGTVIVLVPLRAALAEQGVLIASLPARQDTLDDETADLLSAFADQASLVVDHSTALADRQELMLVAERDRIARDLHDVVIQRIFATGLQLQGVRKRIHDEEVAAMLSTALTDLDTTIRDIRSTIFELQHTRKVSLRGDVRALVKEYVPVLGFTPLVRTTGPVDSLVPANIAGQLLAVLREGLSNVVKHADADACMVEVDVVQDRVVLKVIDNGRGLGPDVVESGLRNARRRAIDLGGTLTHSDEEVQGTRLEWQVPFTH